MHTMTLGGYTQLLVPDARDTATMAQMIRDYHPVLQFGVPTQFMKLMIQNKNQQIEVL